MSVQERKRVPRAREPRLLAHPFEVCTAWLFITSAIGLTKYLSAGVETTRGLLALPDPIVWAWVAALAIGGPAVVAGVLLGNGKWGRAIERAGLYLSGAAWVTLTAVAVWADPTGWLGWSPLGAVALACGLRLLAIRRLERVSELVAKHTSGGAT